MIKVFWATRLRSFFKHISNSLEDVEFNGDTSYYATNSMLYNLKSKLIGSKLFDVIGLFQVIDISGKNCQMYGSLNRFLKADKPYFIYLENPTALYNYAPTRIKYKTGKNRFARCINDKNLRYIVCWSDACKDSFEKINGAIPDHIKVKTIYLYIPDNKYVTSEKIDEKSNRECLEVLYCVQGIRFVSKGGLEVISAVNELHKQGVNIHLNIITKISDLDKYTLKCIENCDCATLNDFNYPYDELEQVYANTNILLQPSSDDSFGATILEAMKGGCALITSKMYAFSEMVKHGENGFLVEPKYWFFDKDNIPNPAVWYHRKKTIYSHKESRKLIDDLKQYIKALYDDREMLKGFCYKSWDMAENSEKFSEKSISNQWREVLMDIMNDDRSEQ